MCIVANVERKQQETRSGLAKRHKRGALRLTRTANLRTQQIGEADTDPFKLARVFVDAEGSNARGELTIHFWRGQWFRYKEGRYVETDEGTMRVTLTGFIKTYFDEQQCIDNWGFARRVSKALVGNALNALSAIVVVLDETEMPVWLGDDEQGPFLATQNGLLDISSLSNGCIRLQENSPLWFSTVAFPVDYVAAATCQDWLAFLREVMEDDEDRINLLQEWAGYLLTPDTTQHKFVVAEGDGANGKSVCFDVLTALIGPGNVAHIPLEMFGERFQLTATLQKLANICAEVGEIDKVAEGFLKQFTAGDRMYFDRKNILGVMAYPTARLMLSSNNRPRFRDRSSGLWRRMIVIPFRVTIPPERQDPRLSDKLKDELPGIFLWALEGLIRLQRNRTFRIPAVCQETLEDYRQESNPAKVFLLDVGRQEPAATIECQSLYERYVQWSNENRFEVLDARQFGKEVKKAFPLVERTRTTTGGKRPWVYRGLSLSCVPSRPIDFLPADSRSQKSSE